MAYRTSEITSPSDNTAQITLYPTEHFDWSQSLKFIDDSGATNHLDHINDDNTELARPLRVGDVVYWIHMAAAGDDGISLKVRSADDTPKPNDETVNAAADWANRRFFMDVEMSAVERALDVDKYGEELLTRFFPARPANYPSAWEALVKSVVHMQIYPGFAAQLDDYLCRNLGTQAIFDGESYYMVPTPSQLLAAIPDDLKAARFSRQKADFLTTIPVQIRDEPEKFDFEAMREWDGEKIVKTLKELHGVGDWVAQNTAMRGLPHTDVFIDEKATRGTLTPYYGSEAKLGKRDMRDAVAQFAPYRTFACYYTYMKHFQM